MMGPKHAIIRAIRYESADSHPRLGTDAVNGWIADFADDGT
jgi:hypothetical protein